MKRFTIATKPLKKVTEWEYTITGIKTTDGEITQYTTNVEDCILYSKDHFEIGEYVEGWLVEKFENLAMFTC